MTLLVIILVGVIFAALIRLFVKKDLGDALFASITFAPALIFWIHDKDISELTGFGLSAKFASEAKKEVSSADIDIKDLAIFSLSADDPNFARAAFFEACADYFVIRPSKVPKEPSALVDHIVFTSSAIKSSLACGRLIGVIVLDDNDRYLGSYDKGFFAESLSIWAVPDGADQIEKEVLSARIMRTTIFGAALRFPDKRITPGEGFVAAINENSTIDMAFNEFQETGASFLVVTDATGRFRGILSYRNVIQTLLSVLLDDS